MRRDENLDDWRIFCAVAHALGIQEAADQLDLAASTVSRTVGALERAVGAALIDRTKRPFALTPQGEAALFRAERLLAEHEAMMEEIARSPDRMAGTLRVALPPAVLETVLVSRLVEFHRAYPELELDLVDRTEPLPVTFRNPGGMLDVIASFGPDPASEDVVQIRYGTGYVIPCASPLYLERHGMPSSPDELRKHTGIIFQSRLRPPVTELSKDGVTKRLLWRRTMNFTSARSAKAATLVGLGIHSGIPTLHCHEEFLAGKLVPVLKGWSTVPLGLYLYIRPESLRLKRVRVFARWYTRVMNEVHREVDEHMAPILREFFAGTNYDLRHVELNHPLFLERDD